MASAPPPTTSADRLPQSTDPPAADLAARTASCHCGRVKLVIPSPPKELKECHCSVCYKYGVLWAYYPHDEVLVTVAATDKADTASSAKTDVGSAGLHRYVRNDRPKAGVVEFDRCAHCGCMTHWWIIDPSKIKDVRVMGINARMLPESAIEGLKKTVVWQ